MIKFNLGPFGCISDGTTLTINLGILTMVEHKHKMTTERGSFMRRSKIGKGKLRRTCSNGYDVGWWV